MTTLLELNPKVQAQELADLIGWPCDTWPANCYAIAAQIIERGLIPGGVLRYGVYLGEVAPGAKRYGFHPKKPMHRHGWIELPDGTIYGHGAVYDPTHWVFVSKVPAVRIVPARHCNRMAEYDAGANGLAWEVMNAHGYPLPNRKADRFLLDVSEMTYLAMRRVVWHFGGLIIKDDLLSIEQIAFFGSAPPQWFGLACATELYNWIKTIPHGTAYIKEDHRRDVLLSRSLPPLHRSVPRLGVLAACDPPNPLDTGFRPGKPACCGSHSDAD